MDFKLQFVTEKNTVEFNGLNMPFIKVETRGLYLTLSACKRYGISAGMYLHLAKGHDERGLITGWYIVVNNDKKDGYKLSKANHGACLCLSRPLARLFMVGTRSSHGDGYYLKDTGSEMNNFPVIEIKTNKTVEDTKKELKNDK